MTPKDQIIQATHFYDGMDACLNELIERSKSEFVPLSQFRKKVPQIRRWQIDDFTQLAERCGLIVEKRGWRWGIIRVSG